MKPTRTNVFLSVGRTRTEEQGAFVAKVQAILTAKNLDTVTVATTDSREDPVRLVTSLMDQCKGVVLIAFERLAIDKGREWRGNFDEQMICGTSLTTPWNQIEGAIAYSKNLPLLILKETAVKEEGILEHGWERRIYSTGLDMSFEDDPAFHSFFSRWLRDVISR